MNHSLLIFGFAATLWVVIRVLTWPMPALFTRVFWGLIVVVAAGAAMLAATWGARATEVCQQMAGGLAGAEIVVTGIHQRWQRLKQRHAERVNGSGRS